MTHRPHPLPDAPEIEARLLAFLQRELLGPGVIVGRDTDLLSGEVLDSMSVLRLAAFVGQEFQLDIQPSDFVVENFRTLAVVAAYVRRSIAARPAGSA